MSNFTKPNRTHQANAVNSHKWMPFLALSTFAIILFGIKLWVIGTYGNAIPLWDQWYGEAVGLYKPFLEGTLGWGEWFSSHNEHRIFTTRLLALTLLVINGVWNPLLQMVVNAALHVATLGFTVVLLARVVGRKHLPVLLVFSLVLFGVPYAFENILLGFQSAFYFVLLFSIMSMWLIVTKRPLSLQWWGGVAYAILAFFSLASGSLALAAPVATYFVLYITGLRRNREQLIAIFILTSLFILCVKFTPVLAYHSAFKAHSFSQLYNALMSILGWPISTNLFSALVLNLPALVFIGVMFLQRPPVNDRKWFLLTLIIWTFGQALIIAYSRANFQFLSSRYLDLFAMSILVNFACLISIAEESVSKQRLYTIISVSAWSFWSFMILIYLCVNAGSGLLSTLASLRDLTLHQELNTRNYLATNNISYLQKPNLIPHDNSKVLALILSMPTVRSILPSNLTSTLAANSGTTVAIGRLDSTINALLAFFHLEPDPPLARLDAFFHLEPDPFLARLDAFFHPPDPVVDFPEKYKEARLTYCGFNQAVDQINESIPIANQPKLLITTRLLKVIGWLTFSAKDSVTADETFITLTNAQGIVKYVKTHRTARPDIKEFFKQPTLPEDVGFIANIDIGKLTANYKLGLARVHAGVLEQCLETNIPITINQTIDHESQ